MDILLEFDGALLMGDIRVESGDLKGDESYLTAVIVSLFTNRRAGANIELPAGETDRMGWWGDYLADQEGDQIGSLRWLYIREKATRETLNNVVDADRKALQWMINDGKASDVTVAGAWLGDGLLQERIGIRKPDGTLFEFVLEQPWKEAA